MLTPNCSSTINLKMNSDYDEKTEQKQIFDICILSMRDVK